MTVALARALNDGLRAAMDQDDKVVILGLDVGRLGGVFRVTDGLQKDFGQLRVMDTPLGEAGIIGTAIGLAMRGYRPVCEIQFDGFTFPGLNQLITQLAKYRHRSGGLVGMPVVVRIPVGGGIGAVEHHSESPEAYFAHTAGLKVVECSTPQDGYTMIRQAIESDDPVIFLEPKRRYWVKGEVDPALSMPLHQARIVRPGTDLTLVAYGAMVAPALEAAAELERQGHSAEVVDLRSLAPIDHAAVAESVRRTGRLIVVHEASRTLGIGAEVAAQVQETAFYALEAPVLRVTGYDTPYPPSRLEEHWLPGTDRILDAAVRSLAY
jgi:2-oxoisovalerate dehydrogenase E1 component beta subunit